MSRSLWKRKRQRRTSLRSVISCVTHTSGNLGIYLEALDRPLPTVVVDKSLLAARAECE